jgi:hypothetical protein
MTESTGLSVDLKGERGYLTLVPLPSLTTVQALPATGYSILNVREVGDTCSPVSRYLAGLPATVSSQSHVHVLPVREPLLLPLSPHGRIDTGSCPDRQDPVSLPKTPSASPTPQLACRFCRDESLSKSDAATSW